MLAGAAGALALCAALAVAIVLLRARTRRRRTAVAGDGGAPIVLHSSSKYSAMPDAPAYLPRSQRTDVAEHGYGAQRAAYERVVEDEPETANEGGYRGLVSQSRSGKEPKFV